MSLDYTQSDVSPAGAARLAEERGDFAGALVSWQAALSAQPGHAQAFLGAMSALRRLGRGVEAEAAIAAEPDRLGRRDVAALFAVLAEDRKDWDQALVRWEAVGDAFPLYHEGILGAARALSSLGRHADADALLALHAEVPDAGPGVLASFAQRAATAGDWPEALRRWAAMIERFPERQDAAAGHAEALLAMGRVEEAEAALGELVTAFPASAMIAELHATAAARRGDHQAAAARWEMMAARFPTRPACVLGQARSLAALGDVEAAEALLTQASERIGQLPDFKAAFAEMASGRRDWAEAVQRWAAVVADAPDRPKGVTAQAEALAELGELAQAEALLEANLGRFRDNLDFVRVRARLADRRADWIEALGRWEDVRGRFPAAYDGHFGAAQVLCELRRFDAADSALAEAIRLRPVSKAAAALQYRIDSDRSLDVPVAAGGETPDAGLSIKAQPSPAHRPTHIPAGPKPSKKQRRAGRQRRS